MAPSDAAPRTPNDFQQLKLLFTDPIQHDDEVIRPIVLFSERIAARSEQTGFDRSTVGEKARRFMLDGMLGRLDQRATKSGRKPHAFPDPVARYILYLKHLYPPIHHREIVRIVARKFGYTTNHHTVKRFLEQHPIPVQLPLEWTLFHEFEDAYRARWTVVRMYYEGWHMQSIAGCLHLSRQHISNIIAAFEQDGFGCYLYPWWIIPGPNRLSALISGDRAQIGPYQPCPLQSFSAVDSHFSALESHTAHLCERMNK